MQAGRHSAWTNAPFYFCHRKLQNSGSPATEFKICCSRKHGGLTSALAKYLQSKCRISCLLFGALECAANLGVLPIGFKSTGFSTSLNLSVIEINPRTTEIWCTRINLNGVWIKASEKTRGSKFIGTINISIWRSQTSRCHCIWNDELHTWQFQQVHQGQTSGYYQTSAVMG